MTQRVYILIGDKLMGGDSQTIRKNKGTVLKGLFLLDQYFITMFQLAINEFQGGS